MTEERTFPDFEKKWQQRWDAARQAPSSETAPKGEDDFYVLSMFPYPSGRLHFGHALPYTLTDSMARYLRMNGKSVLNPMGWDGFGLPAENAAIQNKTHPGVFTYENIAAMRKQMHAFGYSFDWDRELFTCKPDYYKWTQWIFLQMLEKGVAYRKTARVNWCTQCNTVLANEQVQTLVKDGDEFQACERCESRVIPKELPAWYLRITDYADRLLEGLDKLGDDWPERVSSQQRYWIGRSQGVNIDFTAKLGDSQPLTVFTTRADTVFGVTFVALAPEHPLVEQIIAQSDEKQAKRLREFVKEVLTMTEQDRAGGAEKEGINTGFKAVNPLNGEEVPIFVANYVLMYGTGAVMAVPAHDERDHEFAGEYKLPLKQVIEPRPEGRGAAEGGNADIKADIKQEAFTEPGILINSGKYDGLATPEAIANIAADLGAEGKGGPQVNYKLRDWGISRQRYWGCPIPVIHCGACGIVPVPEQDLPVTLPDDVDFLPTGQSPLTLHPDFQHVKCPKCGGDARRDTDTMDTFVDSSWYFLRYTDSHNSEQIFDKGKCAHWAPVDLYIGGREHAIMHLIYARFYTRFLHDIGLIDFEEPFKRLYAHGLIQGESIRVVNEHMNRYVSHEEFTKLKKEGRASDGDITRRIEKMSKSKKNGADPTALMEQYGADATRLAILFLGPGDADSAWDANGMKGPYSFLRRWYDAVLQYAPKIEDLPEAPDGLEYSPAAKALRAAAHSLIDKVTREFEGRYAFNTAIAQGMALLNDISAFARGGLGDDASRYALREAFEAMVVTLAPFVPHTAEELNEALGHTESVFSRKWPRADPAAMQLDEVEIPVQVNGKVRGTIMLPREADKAAMEKLAMENENVQKFVDGKQITKLIAVPGRIVNIVAK